MWQMTILPTKPLNQRLKTPEPSHNKLCHPYLSTWSPSPMREKNGLISFFPSLNNFIFILSILLTFFHNSIWHYFNLFYSSLFVNKMFTNCSIDLVIIIFIINTIIISFLSLLLFNLSFYLFNCSYCYKCGSLHDFPF